MPFGRTCRNTITSTNTSALPSVADVPYSRKLLARPMAKAAMTAPRSLPRPPTITTRNESTM